MTQTTLLEKALAKVKENGFKYTKKRETLLDYLIKCNRYVAAREVYNYLNDQFPGLSYDTVYR
ncbi:MAG: transcriptional repressor, partial [Enterococcus hulanensis]